MSWYYVENGQQAGPVSESELEAMVASGRVSPETLVWKEGMENWQSYSQARSAGVLVADALPPAPGSAAQGSYGSYTPGATTGGLVQCNECARYFGEDEVIRYGTATVCASCKPGFVQRIKEGGSAYAGTLDYAGFWIRFVAKLIDYAIGMVAGLVIGFVVGAVLGQDTGAMIMNNVLGIAFGLWYYIYFLGKYGATPGKMAMKLRVVRPDGSSITYGTAGLRYLAEILSGLILAIGYIMAAFDDEKRALHDRLCETRVIRV